MLLTLLFATNTNFLQQILHHKHYHGQSGSGKLVTETLFSLSYGSRVILFESRTAAMKHSKKSLRRGQGSWLCACAFRSLCHYPETSPRTQQNNLPNGLWFL